MKVIFLKHVINVAKEGEVKEVSSWYATNFLFPKNLAKPFTEELKKRLKDKEKKLEKNRVELIKNKHKIIDALNWKKISFALKTWVNNKVYWWIWEKDIIAAIKKEFKINLERKHIYMSSWHIKKIWEEFVYVKLSKDIMAKITVIITNNK